MSLFLSDTENFRGIVQQYERECGFKRGDISGNTNRLKELVAEINLALDDFTALAIQASGRWQWDDSNHTGFPIVEGDLISGQRDITFLRDEQENIILDIHRVLVKNRQGVYVELNPVDEQSDKETTNFTDGRDTAGQPTAYDKTGNGIRFDLVPNYSWRLANEGTRGVKIYINREASYFTYDEPDKIAGIPGIFHSYLYLKPAEAYVRRNKPKLLKGIQMARMELEQQATEYFGKRARDQRDIISPVRSSSK